MVLQCEVKVNASRAKYYVRKRCQVLLFLLPLLETGLWYRPACSSKPLSLASQPLCVGPVEIQSSLRPKELTSILLTNPVMKRTSSRGISSVLSHLFGHGSGNFVHSSARCACGRKTVIIWPIDWIDGRNTFTEYMHLSGYEFRSDLHQNVLCCPEYISSAKLVNNSL